MERRKFLKTGVAGFLGMSLDAGARTDAAPRVDAPAPVPATGSGPMAPLADYPYKVRQTYLNCAALGLAPAPVLKRIRAFTEGVHTEGTAYYFKNIGDVSQAPRAGAARLYGTTAGNIALTSNISETISQFAWWLRPGRGKNVVSIDIECPATTLSWMRVAQESGAEVRLAQVWSDPGSLTLDKVTRLVDKNTAAVCISHVQWVTGYRLDLKALAEVAHANNALLIVDAMHTAGVVPLNVHRDDVDVLVAGGYKWLGSVGGVAACYVRPELIARFNPTLLGAMTPKPIPPYDAVDGRMIQLPDGPSRLEYGNQNHGAKVGFGVGANYLADLGLERVEAHTLRLGTMLADGLRKLGATVVTPEDPALRAGIITARFPGRPGPALSAALEEHGVFVSPRMGMIRFALHVFNDDESVDRTLNILKPLL